MHAHLNRCAPGHTHGWGGYRRFAPALALLILCRCLTLCADERSSDVSKARVTRIEPTPTAQYDLQAALIYAAPGDVIELAAGTFHFQAELNIAVDQLTIRGAGPGATILSFRGQQAGSSGIVATGDAFVVEDLAVEDTAGNGIKTLGCDGVTFRNVRVEWTDGPKSTNGAYGIYPVSCQNVLIDGCVAIAASDAGIYVGQSQDIIVRNSVAKQNVAGIEIENSWRADVYDNIATDNAGGVLVFDLPGLNVTNGKQVRVYQNQIVRNNHPNFASKGSIVSEVPSGTGLMIMSTDEVEVFQNEIVGNQSSGVLVVSFLITERKIKDSKYDPYPEGVSIHHNHIAEGGTKPSGKVGVVLGTALGGRLPDIMFDGLVDESKFVEGELPEALQLSVRENGDASFANVKIADLTPGNVVLGKYRPDRDVSQYKIARASLPRVELPPHPQPDQAKADAGVEQYRSAPRLLSEWGLFDMTGGRWQPADDLLPYDLNTPLFSDYTVKHRAIRLPSGTSMQWEEESVFSFPVGTVIAKTFAYPDTGVDATPGERYLETRVEFREKSGWYGYSYQWREDQTDAELKLGGGAIDVTWQSEDGVDHHTRYQIPNANQCLSCHGRDGAYVPIGPTAANLNRSCIDAPKCNQLTAWVAAGVLHGAPEVDDRPKLAVYNDPGSGSLDARARAWLDVNCAHCHNPSGSARTSGLDLTIGQTDPAKFGVFKSPIATGKGNGDRLYDIVPGKPDESILMYRLESDEPGARMPSLARTMLHEESNALIRAWIAAMEE